MSIFRTCQNLFKLKRTAEEALLQFIRTLIALFKETLKYIIYIASLRLKDTRGMALNHKRIIR